ncbi:MAG: hypothetical protein WCT77_02570 [Bacteroidota bacterium]
MDAISYFRLMVEGKSNLIHAPGYPFLLGFPWRNIIGSYIIRHYPFIFLYTLIIFQHLLNIITIGVLYQMIKNIYNKGAALVFVLFYGLDWSVMACTSIVYPEWFQSSLCVLSFCLIYYAYKAKYFPIKTTLYSISAVIFSWSFLVKYNVLFMGILFLLAFLFETINIRNRLICFGLSLFSGLSIIFLFIILVHKPSTGTYSLSYDKSWVLLGKIEYFIPDGKLLPSNGINTKRLLILNSLLPWDNKGVGPVGNIDYVSPSIRKPYRDKYLYILTADNNTLDKLLQNVEIPEKYNFATAFSPVSDYLGMKESNELGIQVYIESIKAYPLAFSRHVIEWTINNLTRIEPYSFIPINIVDSKMTPLGYGFSDIDLADGKSFIKVIPTKLGFGFVTFSKENYPVFATYDNPYGYYVWLPGAYLFSFIIRTFTLPPPLISIVIFLGFIYYFIQILRGKRDERLIIYLSITLLLIGFIVFSNMIKKFRWEKELQLVLPFVYSLFSISFITLIQFIKKLLFPHRSFNARLPHLI